MNACSALNAECALKELKRIAFQEPRNRLPHIHMMEYGIQWLRNTIEDMKTSNPTSATSLLCEIDPSFATVVEDPKALEAVDVPSLNIISNEDNGVFGMKVGVYLVKPTGVF